ncbi:MAG: lipoprotein [Paracoccaceae bacterium]
MTSRTKRNIIIVLLFVILSAALVGACGRKGDPSTPTPEAEPAD